MSIQLKSLLLGLLAIVTLTTSAQVTIGSGQEPNKGALLDLKDGGAYINGETAVKGLGLPRVDLTNLKPTTPEQLAASIGATDSWNMTDHIGLLVYNTKANGNICSGIHIWDGKNWVLLGLIVEAKANITMTDGDGNVYDAKWFLTDPCNPSAGGAYWTTSNLYSTKDAGGTAFVGGVRLNPAKAHTPNGAIAINSTIDFTGNVAYGENVNAIAATNQSPTMADFAKKFGLFYTHAQAMAVCPSASGWRLPNDPDWDALALAHGGADIAGAVMRANTNYYLANDNGSSSIKWNSNDAVGTVLSGFNALPSGVVNTAGAGAGSFSSYALWWSAATSGSYRELGYDESKLVAHTTASGYYFSVRCVKD